MYVGTLFRSTTIRQNYNETISNHITRNCHYTTFEIPRAFHHFHEINPSNTLLNLHYLWENTSVTKSLCHFENSSFQPSITLNRSFKLSPRRHEQIHKTKMKCMKLNYLYNIKCFFE